MKSCLTSELISCSETKRQNSLIEDSIFCAISSEISLNSAHCLRFSIVISSILRFNSQLRVYFLSLGLEE